MQRLESSCTCRCVTMWSQLWGSYIGSRLSRELHTSCVCSCITSTLDKHRSTCQTVYPQFPHSVADTGWGRLAQRITFMPRTRTRSGERGFLLLWPSRLEHSSFPTSSTLLTPVHSENDSRVYFMIVLTTDYRRRSWTCRIVAPYKFHVDWLIGWRTAGRGDEASTTAALSRFGLEMTLELLWMN